MLLTTKAKTKEKVTLTYELLYSTTLTYLTYLFIFFPKKESKSILIFVIWTEKGTKIVRGAALGTI